MPPGLPTLSSPTATLIFGRIVQLSNTYIESTRDKAAFRARSVRPLP